MGRIGRHTTPCIPTFRHSRTGGRPGRPCRPSRGAPDLTRKWVWRKSNLGPGGFVLSSSPHDLRERPAANRSSGGALTAPQVGLKHPETRRKHQSRILDYPISVSGTSARLNTTERFDFGRGRGASPDGTDRRRPRRRNTQVLACPDRVKHVGSHITKPHHLGPFTAARKTTPDGSKARPPDFFHPLLLHDDIRHATASADVLRTESTVFLRPSVRCDAMRCAITSAHNLLGKKVTCKAGSTPRPPWPVCLPPALRCRVCQHAGVAFNRRSWGC